MSTPTFADRVHKGFSQHLTLRNTIALVVFGMIIFAFVFSGFLTGKRGGTLGAGVAATVNGEIVSLKQFQDQQNKISAYYSQMLGSQFEQIFQRQQLASETMNQLVNASVSHQAAEKENVFATDANVRQAIQDMPYFKKDGVFQTDLYKGLLQANGMTPADFEKSLRAEITTQKVRDLFEASATTTELEKKFEQTIKSQKMNIEYVQIDSQKIKGDELKKIEDALNTASDLKAFATQSGLTVKETGFFDIANESIPQMGSPKVFNAALDLTKSAPFSKKIIEDGSMKYVISLKDLKVDTSAPVDNMDLLGRQKPYGYFQKWVAQYRKKFDVTINNDLLK